MSRCYGCNGTGTVIQLGEEEECYLCDGSGKREREEMKEIETIEVSVGDLRKTYHIVQTRAPKDYDGFGTFTIHEYDAGPEHKADSFRVVLIPEDAFKWQTLRYASGMFAFTAPEYVDDGAIQDALWKRIRGVTE